MLLVFSTSCVWLNTEGREVNLLVCSSVHLLVDGVSVCLCVSWNGVRVIFKNKKS
jgi:hypothetical protein